MFPRWIFCIVKLKSLQKIQNSTDMPNWPHIDQFLFEVTRTSAQFFLATICGQLFASILRKSKYLFSGPWICCFGGFLFLSSFNISLSIFTLNLLPDELHSLLTWHIDGFHIIWIFSTHSNDTAKLFSGENFSPIQDYRYWEYCNFFHNNYVYKTYEWSVRNLFA